MYMSCHRRLLYNPSSSWCCERRFTDLMCRKYDNASETIAGGNTDASDDYQEKYKRLRQRAQTTSRSPDRDELIAASPTRLLEETHKSPKEHYVIQQHADCDASTGADPRSSKGDLKGHTATCRSTGELQWLLIKLVQARRAFSLIKGVLSVLYYTLFTEK